MCTTCKWPNACQSYTTEPIAPSSHAHPRSCNTSAGAGPCYWRFPCAKCPHQRKSTWVDCHRGTSRQRCAFACVLWCNPSCTGPRVSHPRPRGVHVVSPSRCCNALHVALHHCCLRPRHSYVFLGTPGIAGHVVRWSGGICAGQRNRSPIGPTYPNSASTVHCHLCCRCWDARHSISFQDTPVQRLWRTLKWICGCASAWHLWAVRHLWLCWCRLCHTPSVHWF
mmetsp:Transcript_64750/g.115144  ORF Transcript_64750/g.115144 Transcript_64750/m.115144 type:complete len:224 (+) Transcript_64750:276-947(+)